MPVGGGNPKVLGDGMVVKLRPDATRGGADLWDMRDAIVALMEELDKIYDELAGAADFAAFQTALAAGRTSIKLLDMANGQE
jgi:hypothetical protein